MVNVYRIPCVSTCELLGPLLPMNLNHRFTAKTTISPAWTKNVLNWLDYIEYSLKVNTNFWNSKINIMQNHFFESFISCSIHYIFEYGEHFWKDQVQIQPVHKMLNKTMWQLAKDWQLLKYMIWLEFFYILI